MKRTVLGAAVTAVLLISSVISSGPASAGRLHPELDAHLRALPPGDMLSVIVEMTVQADPPAAAATAPSRARAARRRALVDALQDVANRHQRPIHALLAREHAAGRVHRVAPLWIFNGLAITATEPVIRALAAHADVWEVRPDRIIPPPAPVPAGTVSTAVVSEWNIDKVRAPEVWSLGYTGVGSVVGSFDTGVDPTHPDLASRYGGFWYDPYGEHATPFDYNNHGTHTTGTAVGGDASGKNIGVAPGATWIAAKAWNDAGIGLTSAFHQIFQWFLAPGGNSANAPDVVNSSWAYTSTACITEFLPDVQALRAAGIFPAFAAGNSGPSGGTALSPGNYAESFAIGATDSSDNIASFSSRGPSPCDGLIRPDVSAPGVSVLSSVPGGYATYSGTSMATPHVTGAVALLRSINPSLTVDQLESALTQGAVDLGTAGWDNNFGAGRLDLFQSAQLAMGANPGQPDLVITSLSNPPATVVAGGSFTVTDTTRNSGTATAGGSTTRYRFSTDATITGGDVLLTGSRSVPSLVAGASNTASVTVTVPSNVAPGTYYLGGCADDTSAVIESNETNNCLLSTTTVQVQAVPAQPDLVVSALSFSSSSVRRGGSFTVTDTTRNSGTATAGGSTTRYRLSKDATITGSDVLLTGSRSVSSLTAGASNTASVTVTVPSTVAVGTYYLGACADNLGAVTESNETNNCRASTTTIRVRR